MFARASEEEIAGELSIPREYVKPTPGLEPGTLHYE
jgi:hypothetical protein